MQEMGAKLFSYYKLPECKLPEPKTLFLVEVRSESCLLFESVGNIWFTLR